MGNFLFRHFFVVFLGLLVFQTVAQKKYFVSLIDSETGLAQSTVYAMMKDARGFVWFGTAQSLSRFDGSRVKNYDTQALIPQNKLIRAIVEDANADLWLGMGDCLVRFDRKKEKFIPVKTQTSLGLDFVKGWPLAVRGTKIWCISPLTGEVFYYDYQTHKKVTFLTQIPFFTDNNNFFNGSFYDQKSSLWLHLAEGVLRFDLNSYQSAYFFSNHPHNQAGNPNLFSYFFSYKDSLIVGNAQHAVALHTASYEQRPTQKIGQFNAVNNSVVTLSDTRFDFTRDFGDGILWIRRSHGVYKLSPLLPKFQKVTQATHREFNHEASVRSITSLNDSIVRIGTRISNYWYNRRTQTFTKIPDKAPFAHIAGRLLKTSEGYWIASPKGLCLYNPQKNTTVYFPNPDTLTPENRFANVLFKVMETSPTTLLVSSESGLFVFRKKRRSYHRIPYFGLNRGRFPFMDGTGRLYISNENLHVGRLRDTAWIPEKTLPVTHRFRNGFEDTLHHVIWGATTNGAKMINPRDWSVRLWNKKDGLNDAYIYDVLVDKQGKVWFSTNRGISRLDLKTKKIDNFKLRDGLQSNEFNSNTAHIAPDGEFFFGGVRGFNHFYPEEIQINTQLATPILTSFKVREKPFKLPVVVGEASQIQLSAANNTFSIEYSAIDYLSNGQNTYQYRLIGLDSTWIEANGQTNPLFIQVPAGKYTFEVKAANSDGVWNVVPTKLVIEIAPQIWETIWFRVAMLLLLLAGMYGFYRYRLYLIQQQQRKEMAVMVETQEAERMRFAQDLHDGLGANLSAMKMVLGLLSEPSSLPIKAKTEYLLKESIDDLRQLIHAMSPRSLARLGLVKAIQEMAILINQTGKVQIAVESEDFPENLPDEMQLNLYRMVQELFQNALKHAQAEQITLKLEQNSRSLMLHYTDNGRGFDIAALHTSGNGLSNLHTRAQLLNGKLDIKSVVGAGTMVKVEVPF